MQTLYIDWSHGKIDVLVRSTNEHFTTRSLDALLDKLTEPTTLIMEASFESFFRETKRNDFIRRCADEGHELLTVPNRATGRWKLKFYPPEQFPQYYGNNAKFPDELAVDLFRKMHDGGVHLKKPRLFNENDPKISIRKEANNCLMLMRYTKRPKIGKNGQELKGMVSAKEYYAEGLIENYLPNYDDLEEYQKIALGNGTEYSKVIVAAVGVAAHFANGDYREFDRLSGMYHHAYPSQIRSDLHFHGWWKTPKGKTPKRDLITLSQYRKSIRWLFSNLKSSNTDPKAVLEEFM